MTRWEQAIPYATGSHIYAGRKTGVDVGEC
ncbi:MAG: hypothetical protein FD153_349 [Rhodospirillaceae bacterium]|nr:MAG: hypothetical protein FD153_349 [Rhodospirillaceae bacterium]